MSAEFRQRIAEERTAVANEELRNIRVLIVDDNATNRTILRGLLQGWEVTVCDVESGERALEELLSAKSSGKSIPDTLDRYAYAWHGRLHADREAPAYARIIRDGHNDVNLRRIP